MEKLEEFWVQPDFKERLILRPYQFQSFSYNDKTQMALSSFRIKATNKKGLENIFDDLTDLRDAYMVQWSI